MRVAVVSDIVRPGDPVTGVVSRRLALLLRCGHATVLLAPAPLPESAAVLGARVVVVRAGWWAALPVARRSLAVTLRDFAPDVVHLASTGPLTSAARTVARELGVPAVVVQHEEARGGVRAW